MKFDPEKLAARRHRINASEAGAILGLNPWQTPYEVWAEKTGRIPDDVDDDTDETRLGTVLEPALLDAAERDLGPLTRNQRRVGHGLPFPLSATCDAIVRSTKQPVEAKTAGLKANPRFNDWLRKWGEADTDEVPDMYAVQLICQMQCTGAQLSHVRALIAGRGIVAYAVPLHDRLRETVMNRLNDWWHRHIVGGVMPSTDPAPPIDVVKIIKREPGKVIDLGANFATLWDQQSELAKASRDAKKQADEIKAVIGAEMDDAEVGTLPDGSSITYTETVHKPKTCAGCGAVTTPEKRFRVMRFKKPPKSKGVASANR